MNRRTVLLSVTLAASTLVGACSGGGADSSLPMSDAPFCVESRTRVEAFAATHAAPSGGARGGTITVGHLTDLDGLNPLSTTSYEARQHQIFVNLMTLVRYNQNFEAEPYLAESWTVSDDGTQLEFTLRDDVFWHDGTPTTAQDVAFTLERAQDPETGFANAAFFDPYTAVEVVDDRTVRFTMTPHAEPLDPWRATAILPAHLLGDVPSAELAAHPFNTQCPVGNGPFRFVSHEDDAFWVFDANLGFPAELGGPPAIDRYVYRIIPDQATALNELRAGGIDMYPVMRPDQAAILSEFEDFEVIRFTSLDYSFIAWNTRREVLSDARVRRALTMALDREAIVEGLIDGFGTVANHGVPPALWPFDAQAGSELSYDPAAAEQLLDEAGWIDRDGDGVRENAAGTALSIELLLAAGNETRSRLGQSAQASFRDVGVELRLQPLEGPTMVGRATSDERDFDAFTISYTAEFAVNDYDLFHSEAADGIFAWSGVNDPEVDALLDSLQVPSDRPSAMARWSRYQQMIAELSPWAYLYFSDRVAGVADHIRGVSMDARGEWVTIQEWTTDAR